MAAAQPKIEPNEVVDSSPEVLREQSIRRIKKRRDFHAHLFAYVVINMVIWGIWSVIGMTNGWTFPWPLWITLGWGVGVVFNAWDVYGRRPITEDEIRREMQHLTPHE